MASLWGTGSAPKTELLINGAWTDLSHRPRGERKITITRGRANEQSTVTAQTCQMDLNNRDGLLSNRNPSSAYFGLLPRNTQVRITAGAGDNYLRIPYSDSGSLAGVSTADKPVLDVAGDIDIRADIWPSRWRPGLFMVIAAKYAIGGNQRSWVFYLGPDGKLQFRWSPDGTLTNQLGVGCDTAVPATSTRLSVRVVLDVNNGAAGNDTKFYTASTIGGTYAQLGSTTTKATVTSIFNSSAALTFGGGADSQGVFSNGMGYGGRLFELQVYNGIAGTLVADLNPAGRSVGDSSWSDGLGTPNTWTVTGNGVRVTTDRLRFWGELSSLPQTWDKTGTDVYVPVTASGMIRRLTQGASPLNSPMYRNFNQYGPTGYWPFEDGSVSLAAASGTPSGLAGVTTNVTFGVDSAGLPGADSVVQLKDATSKIYMQAVPPTNTGTASFVLYVQVSALPASEKVFATFYTNGTARRITVALTSTAWITKFYGSDGTLLATGTTSVSGIDPHLGWVGYNLLMQTSGADIAYSVRWDTLGGGAGGVGPTTISTATVGVPIGAQLESWADAVYNDAKFAHMFMSNTAFDLTNSVFRNASAAWLGETAAARMARLCTEESVPYEIWGFYADSEVMGYQTTDTFVNLIYDCWTVDAGIGGESRDFLSLFYRVRTHLERRADLAVSYAASHLSEVPLPTEDDQGFTNDVTVTRTGGGSARAVRTEGPTSVSQPPAGVGRYDTGVTRNVATEARLPSVAGWLMLVGSWDDSRYPNLTIGLHRREIFSSSSTLTAVIGAELGDTAVLSGLPSWQPPDAVPELIQGYTETLGKFTWEIVYNCTPAGPYGTGAIDDDTNPIRLGPTTHTIGSLTTTGTSASFTTPSGAAVWVDSTGYPAEFPFNIKVTGEVITVTAISGTSSPQTATLTRSVNGIVKTHLTGETIRLEHESYVGR